VADFNVHTGSLRTASRVLDDDARSLQGEFAWLNMLDSFEDPAIEAAVSDLLLTWRITTDQVVGDLYKLAGNLQAADASYSAAEKAIATATMEAAPEPIKHGEQA
jgi:hypothetical protein